MKKIISKIMAMGMVLACYNSVALAQPQEPIFKVTKIRLQVEASGEKFSWLGKKLNKEPLGLMKLEDIRKLQTKANELLKAKGLVTTKAQVPNQQLHNGELVINILPGKVEKIEFNQPGFYGNALEFGTGDVLDINKIRGSLGNLENVPNQKASANFKEGEQGTVVSFNLTKGTPVIGGWEINNYGDEEFGSKDGNLWLQTGNLLGLSDSLYLSYNHNLKSVEGGSNYTYVNYSLPLAKNTFTYTYQQSRWEQGIPYYYGYYRSKSLTTYNDFRFRHKLTSGGQGKWELVWGIKHRVRDRFINEQILNHRKEQSTTLEIGLHGNRYMGPTYVDGSVTWRKGLKMKSKINEFPSFPPGGTNYFNIYNGSFFLWTPVKFNDKYSGIFTSKIRAQYSTSRLYSGDFFTIGGWYNVRGFNGEHSLSGENGIMIRNELQLPLPKNRNHKLYLGFDYGGVTGPYTKYLIGRELTGMAIGLKGSSNKFNYDLFWSRPLKYPEQLKPDKNLWGFSIGYNW